jgi:hypothetical protein
MTQMGEAVSPSRPQNAADDADYKSPLSRILQIYVYSTKSASSHVFGFSAYARKARTLLLPHRIDIRAYPGLPTVLGEHELIIDWSGPITLHDHKEQIMTMSQKLAETPSDALPVILCTITDSVDDNGETLEHGGRPFVLVYGNHPSADAVTLLHEIGHAAGCTNHPPWGLGRPDKHYSFMATPAKLNSKELEMIKDPAYYRNTIFKPDVGKLAAAKFSVPAGLCFYPPLFFGA